MLSSGLSNKAWKQELLEVGSEPALCFAYLARFQTSRAVPDPLFLPSCSSVTETSVHVPTRFLAVVCAATSLGRKTPKIRADVVMKGKMKRFMGDSILMVWGVWPWGWRWNARWEWKSISQFQPASSSAVMFARVYPTNAGDGPF
jgi:hypothetical protein